MSTAINPGAPNPLAEIISASCPGRPEKLIAEVRKAAPSRINPIMAEVRVAPSNEDMKVSAFSERPKAAIISAPATPMAAASVAVATPA